MYLSNYHTTHLTLIFCPFQGKYNTLEGTIIEGLKLFLIHYHYSDCSFDLSSLNQNQVAIKHPAAVTACNLDLENLITDVNRSIATLAITTLLKTGNESSVDRLMKQISTFMSEISDEFKIVVVQAIRSLCSKFPRKHNVLMTFLAQMLRDEVRFLNLLYFISFFFKSFFLFFPLLHSSFSFFFFLIFYYLFVVFYYYCCC